MLQHLPAPVIGCVSATLCILNTLFVYIVLFLPLNAVKWLVPLDVVRKPLTRAMLGIAGLWGDWNRAIANFCFAPDVRINGIEHIVPDESYLIVCNHQSWSDIAIHGYFRPKHMPFPRFFLKYELIWVPVIGWACWAMDFPFMRRATKAERENNPAIAHQDVHTTREACKRFRDDQVNVMNYAEGTRFTEKKRVERKSPYRYLLRPKCGGTAMVVGSMGDQFDAALDITLVYAPNTELGIWNYLRGDHRRIVVNIQKREIPVNLLDGDYHADPIYRENFQNWLNAVWRDKDETIHALRQQHFSAESTAQCCTA